MHIFFYFLNANLRILRKVWQFFLVKELNALCLNICDSSPPKFNLNPDAQIMAKLMWILQSLWAFKHIQDSVTISIPPLVDKLILREKILHTEDTEYLDVCGY